MKVFKILHKPTGLYFKPSNGTSNLSKKGKIYSSNPSLSWIGTTITIKFYPNGKLNEMQRKIVEHFHLEIPENRWKVHQYVQVPKSDWEIIEIE